MYVYFFFIIYQEKCKSKFFGSDGYELEII